MSICSLCVWYIFTVKCSTDTYRPWHRHTHLKKIMMLALVQYYTHTHTHCCRVRLSVDWMSMEVTRHQTDLPTQYTVESAATRANNTCVYAELQQSSAFAHALLRLHIQVNRVWKCIYKTKCRGGLDASRQQEPNKLHEKCMSKVWAHTLSQFAVLPLTHTQTKVSMSGGDRAFTLGRAGPGCARASSWMLVWMWRCQTSLVIELMCSC